MNEKYTLAQWLNNDLSVVELNEFKASEDYLIYEKIKKYTNQLTTQDFDSDRMLTTILASKKSAEPKIIPLYKKAIFKIAASIIFFAGIGYFYNQNKSEVVVAQNNQKTEFLLPDNSEIALNLGSTIEYKKNNWDNNRNLNLSGEAYFKVAKGKTFSVETKMGTVQVLGTQFNVFAKNNVFKVVCFEGKVRVKHNNTEIVLNPTQTVTIQNDKIIDNASVNYSKPEWLNNQLEFNNVNLNLLLANLSDFYKINVNQENVASNKLFTGTIPSDNLEVALKIIASTYQIKFVKKSDNQYVIENL